MVSIHWLKMLDVCPIVSIIDNKILLWTIVSIDRLKISFFLTTINLIYILCCQLIICIDLIDDFVAIGAHLWLRIIECMPQCLVIFKDFLTRGKRRVQGKRRQY